MWICSTACGCRLGGSHSGERSHHISATGIAVPTHGLIDEANHSDVVLFVSGQGTRTKMKDQAWLSRFKLDPGKQMIGSICSERCCWQPLDCSREKRPRPILPPNNARSLGVTVEEKAFIEHGDLATAGGCLQRSTSPDGSLKRKQEPNGSGSY